MNWTANTVSSCWKSRIIQEKLSLSFFFTPKFSNVALFVLERAPIFLCHSHPFWFRCCVHLAKGIAEWNRDWHSRGVAWHVEWWSRDFMTWHHSFAKVSKWDICMDLSNHIPRQVKREISLNLETVKGASLGWYLRKWSMLGLVASWALNDFLKLEKAWTTNTVHLQIFFRL